MIDQMRFPALSLSLLLATAAITHADNKVNVTLASSSPSALPGTQFDIALHFTIPDGWHLYNTNPGDTGSPPKIKWNLPPGVTASDLKFPPPETIKLPENLVAYGYEHELTLTSIITVDPQFDAERPIDLAAQVRWVVCDKEACLAEKQDVNLSIRIGPVAIAAPSDSGSASSANSVQPARPMHEQIPGDVFLNSEGAGVISIRMPADFASESDFTIDPPAKKFIKIDQAPSRYAIVGGMVITQRFTLTGDAPQDSAVPVLLHYTTRDQEQKTVEVLLKFPPSKK